MIIEIEKPFLTVEELGLSASDPEKFKKLFLSRLKDNAPVNSHEVKVDLYEFIPPEEGGDFILSHPILPYELSLPLITKLEKYFASDKADTKVETPEKTLTDKKNQPSFFKETQNKKEAEDLETCRVTGP